NIRRTALVVGRAYGEPRVDGRSALTHRYPPADRRRGGLDHLDTAEEETAVDAANNPIRTVGLTKRYGSTLAVDRLDLRVEPGEVYGFLGPNGAGKTTTIRMLLGLHRPSAGSATIFGVDAWHDPVAAHRRVAYVAGEPSLWPQLTAAETLEFLGRLHG